MNRNILLDIFCKFYLQKKRGFTLAEALIITVMTAFCLLPILGTMQNAQILTQKYDHKSKMNLICRSRLNKEIANAAFDHKTIDTKDYYNYVVYLDKGEDYPGCEGNSKLIELSQTTIRPNELITINNDDPTTWSSKCISFLGIDPLSCRPYLKILYAYKTSIEINDNPRLSNSLIDDDISNTFESPKSLLGIVVRTALIKNEDIDYDKNGYTIPFDGDEMNRVVPVTLFAFVNLPVVSDEYIWLADCLDLNLYSIDPVSKIVAGVINLPRSEEKSDEPEAEENDPYRPWRIAVHPSCKMLAVMKKHSISLINIDSKSLYYGKSVDFLCGTVLCNPKFACDNAYKDGGLVFRPDGRFLFYTSCKSDVSNSWRLNCLKLDYKIDFSSNNLIWSETQKPQLINPVSDSIETFYSFNQNLYNVTEVISSSDGFLYVATVASIDETDKNEFLIYRFPMYQNNWLDWKGEIFLSLNEEIESIAVSNDGTKLAVILDNKIRIYDTRNRELLNEQFNISENDLKKAFKMKLLSLSNSTQTTISENNSFFGIVTSKVDNANKNIAATFDNLFKSSDEISLKDNFYASEIENPAGGYAVVSPDNREVIINDREKPYIYFTPTGLVNNSTSLKESEQNLLKYKNNDDELKDCSDLAANTRDILAVSLPDKIQLYDLNRMNKLDEESFPLTASLTSLVMNPHGDMILGGYGLPNNNTDGNHGFSRFHLHNLSIVNPFNYGAYTKKIVFDDRTPNMVFSLEYPGRDNRNDAFCNFDWKESNWDKNLSLAYDRRDLDLDPSWERLDLIGLPKGGAIVLYGQPNGSSLIEWIGRRDWKQDEQKGKYCLFARWTNIKIEDSDVDNSLVFPPLFSKKLAISPDMGTIAVLAGTNVDNTKLNIYDFNASNYGPETQIEGMLVDYRVSSDSGKYNKNIVRKWPHETGSPLFTKVGNGCSFGNSLSSFKEATTRYDSWLSFNDYPANYLIIRGNISKLTDDLNKTKVHHNKRFFGYIRPEYNASRLQSLSSEDVRYFYNHDYLYGRLEKSISFIEPEEKTLINLSSYTSILLQIDQTSDLGGMYLGTFIADETAKQNLTDYSKDLENEEFEGNYERSYYVPKSSLVGWKSLKSEQTYILKNIPSLIGSFDVSSNDNIKIDINTASMLYSKDKAKPILYLLDKSYLFAYYKNGIIRLKSEDSIITNPVISSDGQKFIFGISETTSGDEIKNYLKVLNISSPTIELFNTNQVVVPSDKEAYLGSITKIFVNSIPSILAAKPFNLINSSKIGGEYKILEPEPDSNSPDETPITFSNNFIAVASGGIYIFTNNDKIYCYNPLNNILSKKDTLKTNSYFPAMACYDDVLYLFGNYSEINKYPNSGRVQSYDVNSKKTMKSEIKANDEYWANICTFNDTEWNKVVDVTGGDIANGPGYDIKFKYAFDAMQNKGWRTGTTDTNHWIKYTIKPAYKDEFAFTVNKLKIDNKVIPHGGTEFGVKDFEFFGNTNLGKDSLCVGLSPRADENHEIVFNNTKKYYEYEFLCKSSHDGSNARGFAELKFYRDELKCLTPKGNVNKTGNTNFSWITDDDKFYTIETSEPTKSNFKLGDIYPYNYEEGYYNNPLWNETVEVWKAKNNASNNPFIMLKMPDKEVLKVVRYCNYDEDNYLKKLMIYGSNSDFVISKPTDSTSNWVLITELNNGPEVCKTWITREIDNHTAYKNYLFLIKDYDDDCVILSGFELYADNKMEDDYLTPLLSDNLEKIKAGEMAACSTPYGIAVSGGRLDETGPNVSTNECFLYWPHAINRYDGDYKQYGISRSLSSLNHKRFRHSMLWHKGKIYVIGGCPSSANNYKAYEGNKFIEYLDYNSSMTWENINEDDYVFSNDALKDDLMRYNHGTCSFGDEIFIFGGKKTDKSNLNSAIAINPETKVVRKLPNLPSKLKNCDAVALGSKIYIIGINESNNLVFYEYTP